MDVEDTDEVRELYTDRIVELQVEERVPVYVTTERTRDLCKNDVPATETTRTLVGGN